MWFEASFRDCDGRAVGGHKDIGVVVDVYLARSTRAR